MSDYPPYVHDDILPLLKLMLHALPDGVVPLTVVPLTEIEPDEVLTVGSDGHDASVNSPSATGYPLYAHISSSVRQSCRCRMYSASVVVVVV